MVGSHNMYSCWDAPTPHQHINTKSIILTQFDSCYDSANEQADPMNDPKNTIRTKKNVTAQVPDSTHRRLAVLASRTDMSVAQHLRRAIDEYLDRNEDGNQAELGL